MSDTFFWSTKPEPHSLRRVEILRDHPEVNSLMGHEWKSKYISFFFLLIPQIFLSVYTIDMGFVGYVIVTYFVGATLTQAIFLSIHELSHNLYFKRTSYNRFFSILMNLPIGIPFAVSFRTYHTDHHKQMGKCGVDTDIPSSFEVNFVRGRVSKCVWCCLQILAYSLRPIFTSVDKMSTFHMINILFQMIFNFILMFMYGPYPIFYFLVCVLLSGGLHPCAGHFLTEHYIYNVHEKDEKVVPHETYSYYGPLNHLTWNVGYHNEHHDFPNIPWSRLPVLKKIAPEYYDNLPYHTSWTKAIWNYIFDKKMGPHKRVKRV